MALFIIIFSIYTIFQGAVYGRVDGGGVTGFKVNEWVERSLIMFFFVMACAPFADYWALTAYAGVIGIATGHGQYFLNRSVKFMGDTKERVDPLLNLIFGKDPRTNERFRELSGAAQASALSLAMNKYGLRKLYWRCVAGMFVTGTLVGLPAFALSMCFEQWYCWIFLMTGFAKVFAYMIGYAIDQYIDARVHETEIAEYINGGLRNVICLIVILIALGVW